jgi:hypothetical protein
MVKWEYKVIDLVKEIEEETAETGLPGHWLRASDLEKVLNELGAQGWELVNIHFTLDGREATAIALLKRACQNAQETSDSPTRVE